MMLGIVSISNLENTVSGSFKNEFEKVQMHCIDFEVTQIMNPEGYTKIFQQQSGRIRYIVYQEIRNVACWLDTKLFSSGNCYDKVHGYHESGMMFAVISIMNRKCVTKLFSHGSWRNT